MTTPLAAGSDPLAIPTFIIAVLGLVGALAALAWQFTTFRLSGGRATLEVGYQVQTTGRGVLAWGEMPKTRKEIVDTLATEDDVPLFQIRIRSIGRMPVNIVDLKFTTGFHFSCWVNDGTTGPELPWKIEPGERADWYVNALSIASPFEDSKRYGIRKEVTVWVEAELGDGRTVRSKEPLTL